MFISLLDVLWKFLRILDQFPSWKMRNLSKTVSVLEYLDEKIRAKSQISTVHLSRRVVNHQVMDVSLWFYIKNIISMVLISFWCKMWYLQLQSELKSTRHIKVLLKIKPFSEMVSYMVLDKLFNFQGSKQNTIACLILLPWGSTNVSDVLSKLWVLWHFLTSGTSFIVPLRGMNSYHRICSLQGTVHLTTRLLKYIFACSRMGYDFNRQHLK